ncbi:nucleoside-diphosphate sugar epimerase/dehydratase [Bradyrhizobium sp. TZ2]
MTDVKRRRAPDPYIVFVRSKTVRGRRESRRGSLPETGGGRRRLFAAIRFAGDVVSGVMAIVAAVAIVAVTVGQMGLLGRMQMQMCLLLWLLLGINCSLGLYRSNIRSPMERFRLRVTATLLFVFAGMLMWIREGPLVELAVVPVVGVIALVFGLWVEHLIGVPVAKSGIFRTPTVILGTGARSRSLARLLLSHSACGLRPIGFIDDGIRSDVADELVLRPDSDDPSATLPVLGTLDGWRADGSAEVVIVPDCECLPGILLRCTGWGLGKSWYLPNWASFQRLVFRSAMATASLPWS